jgi:serine/threonine-protein kinase
VPVTALPLPASNSAEALAAYSASLQAARDGNWGYVTSLLERAVALDPTLAIAHLRLAIYYHYDGPHLRAGWAAFGRALLGRSSLNERDQALLEAYEPLYRDPSDRHEVIARLRAATARFPNDAEFHSLLAFMSIEPGDALAAARRTLELDPRSADGWQSLGANLIRVGDTEDGLRALDRCVAISPAAADCRAERGFIHSVEGRCVEMEEDFRAALAGSRSVIWQNGLANALFALGRPLEASLEIYRNKWSQLPEDTRTVTELMDRANLALAVGHFAEAERSGLEARRQMATDLDARTQARVALLLVQTYTETGRLRDAGRIADDFMRRKAGWISSAPFENASIRMYWAMLRAGLLNRERFIEMRDAWLRESEPHAQGALRAAKVAAYASGVETESEARETVQLFPDWESILVDADLMRRALTFGRLYAFTGRSREAAPLLEKVARWCGALSAPMEYVEASFLFGRAQEDVGNTAGACAAYGNVLHFWGDATPPSRTARRARARWLALECKEAPKTRRTL